jgi:unsaturated rhamnogalacturonyl hydrolase
MFRSTILVAACLFVASFSSHPLAAQTKAAIGVTRKGTEIDVLLPPDVKVLADERVRVLVVGGHDGSQFLHDSRAKLGDFSRMVSVELHHHPDAAIAFIPLLHPDGLTEDVSAEAATRGYPPKNGFYNDAAHPEKRYLWRWAAMYAPDLVIDVRSGDENGIWVSANEKLRNDLPKYQPTRLPGWKTLPDPAADDFVRQAAEVSLGGLGKVTTAIVQLKPKTGDRELFLALDMLIRLAPPGRSAVRQEIIRRQELSPRTIVEELSKVYGHDLTQVAYIPALAVIGRYRLAEATNSAEEKASLEKLMAPFLSGERTPIPKSGSDQAGHLLFAELAKRSEGKDRERWIELCRVAADQIFDMDGKPRDLMPFHNEMSDAVFMSTPIMCATGKLTGERKYFDAAVTHFRNMKKLCLRADGIYRHSPLDEAAWGRGNGFPAMGLAWTLSELPEDHPAFAELKADFQNHIRALLKHQDEFGCWHQVIDKPGSYREFSSTCMIGWAIKRGIDRGWLDKEQHQPALDRAWLAAKQRIHEKGIVVDICTGTGKQKSLRDYYDRPAIWGVDARGGAMALMFATEMMGKTGGK